MNKPQRSRSPIKKAAQQFMLQPLTAGDPRYVDFCQIRGISVARMLWI